MRDAKQAKGSCRQQQQQKKKKHMSPPAAAREASTASSSTGSSRGSHRRDLLDGSIQEVSRQTLMERFRKRGRVESANDDHHSRAGGRGEAATALKADTFAHTADKAVVVRAGRAPHHGTTLLVHKKTPPRAHSLPCLAEKADDDVIAKIFPDVCPRDLRVAEVKSWRCSWMDRDFPVASLSSKDEKPQQKSDELLLHPAQDYPRTRTTSGGAHELVDGDKSAFSSPSSVAADASGSSNGLRDVNGVLPSPDSTQELDNVIESMTSELSLEEKHACPPSLKSTATPPSPLAVSTPTAVTPAGAATPRGLPQTWGSANSTSTTASNTTKRPQLRLKLEDMPTPQEAEERAQRRATRLIAKRDAMEAAAVAAATVSGSTTPATNGPSATQQAMKLSLKSFSSGSESDLQSPNGSGRHSAGSAYSPNHGMFTTKNVAVSEAGISSPDAACLHLQENLERVKEVGRGASGIVYKAIHIPTLKVVAVKDVPVYGRGQRRQMVRELHALYSNLTPMADSDSPQAYDGSARQTATKPRPKPSPYIVSFYDAFVDRPRNSICLVMEYMSTGSLQDIVLHGGCQNEKILARLATGVLHGLAHIHKKRMVHRDIKPHNLLTNRQGEVKISDFGLARTLNDNSTKTKTFVGTLLYMAPERIGGGDYSYPADVWSFGLALISVALGRYPLPTQDGFFGLVDSVANEQCLTLPADSYSEECRSFIQECLKIEPENRPSAEELLKHPFILKYTPEETLIEWTAFIEKSGLSEDRDRELESLGDAVYRHMYERSVKFSSQPQSDYGVSFVSQVTPTFSRRHISLEPVQMSLQMGLANHLGVSLSFVCEKFEAKRCFYSDKLLEDYCYSPQSWTASPGIARRQQLFGTGSESPQRAPSDRHSFWRKLQDSMSKIGHGKRKKKERGERQSSFK